MKTTDEYREFSEDTLRKATEMRCAAEQMLLKSGCVESIEESSDEESFLWISLLHQRFPALSYVQKIQDHSEDPYLRLAGLLELLRENSIPEELHMQGLTIRTQGNKLDFCISGSISLDELYKLCGHYQEQLDLPNKK